MFMNVPHVIVGIGSLIAGISSLKQGLSDTSTKLGDLKVPDLSKQSKKPYKAAIYNIGPIDERVKFIIKAIQKGRVNPEVRAFAVKAVSQKCGNRWCVNERDWWGEVQALFKAIRNGVRYVRDIHKVDTFQAPNRTLEFGGGDCDDYTITLGSALQAIGFPIKIRIVQSSDSSDYNHIFLLVGMPPRDPNKWYSLDASLNKPPGWHPPRSMLSKIKDYDIP